MQRMTEEDCSPGPGHSAPDVLSGVTPSRPRPIPAPAPVSRDAAPPDTPATAPGSGVMTCSCCHLWPDTGAVSPCQISAQNPDAGIETEPTFILLP